MLHLFLIFTIYKLLTRMLGSKFKIMLTGWVEVGNLAFTPSPF